MKRWEGAGLIGLGYLAVGALAVALREAPGWRAWPGQLQEIAVWPVRGAQHLGRLVASRRAGEETREGEGNGSGSELAGKPMETPAPAGGARGTEGETLLER